MAPPSVVVSTPAPVWVEPTATHSDVDGHETPETPVAELGSVWAVHVVPPSVVARTAGENEAVGPTAVHTVADGQETDVSWLKSGGYEAVSVQPSGPAEAVPGLATMAASPESPKTRARRAQDQR